jgi:urease accessory protein
METETVVKECSHTSPDGAFPGHGSGFAELVFKPSPGRRTYLSAQYLTYPFHTTRLFYLDSDWPDLATFYLTSASGGLFQGDRIFFSAQAKAGAAVQITTGSATKIHGMERDLAVHTVHLQVEKAAYLEYLVEPAILFPRSRLESHVQLSVEKGGCAVLGDAFLTHDPSGPGVAPFDDLFAEVAIRDGRGELLTLDRTRVAGQTPFLSIPGITGDRFAQGTIYFIWDGKPPDDLARVMNQSLKTMEGIYACASTLPAACGAYARILADDSLSLNHALCRVAAACRKLATGHPMPPARK